MSDATSETSTIDASPDRIAQLEAKLAAAERALADVTAARAAPASAMSGTPADPASPLHDAAAIARESGDRAALLHYLRLRRSA